MKTKLFIPALILFLVLIHNPGFAQHHKSMSFDKHLSSAKSTIDSVYTIATGYPTTGIVLRIAGDDEFTNSFLVAENDTIRLAADDHSSSEAESIHSNLATFSLLIDAFCFYPGKIESEVSFYFIDSRLPEKKGEPAKKKSAGCSEPEMIDQSVWREGLAEPDYERIVHKVYHCIVHHTAGSNTDTEYMQVVRGIYIYHTEIREWSDIGYNYLIAQDGTIFKGRDPGNFEQDNVRGAHFCGYNTGTMGISILGDYTSVQPTEESIESLVEILTWKLGKDSLNPLGTYPHPLNENLGIIAGHRDGCATECPGTLVYALLNTIRQETMTGFTDCGFSYIPLQNSEVNPDELLIFKQDNEVYIQYPPGEIPVIQIFDVSGRALPFKSQPAADDLIILQFTDSTPHFVFIRIIIKGKSFTRALFLPWFL